VHTRIDTAHQAFLVELRRLRAIDRENQSRFRLAAPGARSASLSNVQFSLLSEGVFSISFRQFERFLEEVFVLYAKGKRSPSGQRARPFIAPRSSDHALDLMQSAMTFLEWNSPDKVISRAELYLRDGAPVKNVITAHRTVFDDARIIRNHIAHDSRESLRRYRSVAARRLRIAPANVPAPGVFLQQTDPSTGSYFLLTFLDGFERIALDLCT
jgi:hypothetical protein